MAASLPLIVDNKEENQMVNCAPLLIAAAFMCSADRGEPFRDQKHLQAQLDSLVRSGEVKLPKPSFDWSGKELVYDLELTFRPDPLKDVYEVPVAQQLLVLGIRKYVDEQQYRMDRRRKTRFWSPVLEQVEQEISGKLKDIAAGGDKVPLVRKLDSRAKTYG